MNDDKLEAQGVTSNQLEYPALVWLRGGDMRRDDDSRGEKGGDRGINSLSEFR